MSISLPRDVQTVPWAAEQLGVSKSTAYRRALDGTLPGLYRLKRRCLVSVPKFFQDIHGGAWREMLARYYAERDDPAGGS